MRLRFPKSARLTRAREFLRVKNEGRSQHGRLIVLSVLESGEPQTRIGIITSRRVGNAVARNRVRRRLREMVRVARPRLKAGRWIVIIARQSAAEAEFALLEEEWKRLAENAALFEN